MPAHETRHRNACRSTGIPAACTKLSVSSPRIHGRPLDLQTPFLTIALAVHSARVRCSTNTKLADRGDFVGSGGVSVSAKLTTTEIGMSGFTAHRRFGAFNLLLLTTWSLTTACSAGEDTPMVIQPPTSPSPVSPAPWPLTATVTLTAAGAEPSFVVINVGGRVTFVSNDARAHDMVSDPDLRHDECPVINRVGFLAPGQRRETGVFEAVQSCGFHDHLEPTQFIGRIEAR